jgi:hypothetical protein
LDKSADPPSYANDNQQKQVEEARAGIKRANEGEQVTLPMKKIRMVSTLNSEIKKTAEDKVFYDVEEQELADIDYEEIESMILKPEEVKSKTQVWYAENKEYLKGRFCKHEAEDNEENNPSAKKKKKNQPSCNTSRSS